MNGRRLRKANPWRRTAGGILMILTVWGSPGRAETRTWCGPSGGNWDEPAHWSPAQVPGSGDAVTIDSSVTPAVTVVLSSASAALGSFTVSNAALLFTNWTTRLEAGSVTIGNGGRFLLPGPFATGAMSNRIHVVCTDFSLHEGGLVLADAAGYGMNSGPGKGGWDTGGSGGGGGGGNGGPGGRGHRPASLAGPAYGSPHEPLAPGSGGGWSNNIGTGAGGGAVRIEASGSVTLDGTLSANGGVCANGGGGSGGSVFITCGTFGGGTGGWIRADGGAGRATDGGGGGGRIAVLYDQLVASPRVRFSTAPGAGAFSSVDQSWLAAGWGTLRLSDAGLLDSTLTDDRFTGVRLYADGFTSWTVDTLTVSRCSLELAATGFCLTVNQALTIGERGVLGVGADSGTSNSVLACGSLSLTNGGILAVYGGETNALQDHGARVEVAGLLEVASNSWIYPISHALKGGPVLFRMQTLAIATQAGFHATGRGYGVREGPGAGAGTLTSSRGGGGGYGGRGGDSSTALLGGLPYGSAVAPLDAGSGSGSYSAGGGRGGGAMWIESAGDVRLDGRLVADGGVFVSTGGSLWHSGGGAGGGIRIRCSTLSGNGSLQANGGRASALAGGGGGGRIAIEARRDRLTGAAPGLYSAYSGSSNGAVSVSGGTGYAAGAAGTFFLALKPKPTGAVMVIR